MFPHTRLSPRLHFFIRTILQEHEAHFCSKFKNKLRTIPASAAEKNIKFLIKVVN